MTSFIHSSPDRHLDGFSLLTIMNTAAVNIQLQVLVYVCIPYSWVYKQEWDYGAIL